MRSCFVFLVLAAAGSPTSTAIASGPSDELLRLVPVDSGVTLAVEDLRGHSKQIRESTLFEGLSKLDAVRAWLGSDHYRMFERTSREIEKGLGVSIEVIRDDLLGDAVIFSLQPGPATKPDQARGLLLVRPRDRGLPGRLLASLNDIQTRSGELERVTSRTRAGQTYSIRQFKANFRPPEFTIQLDDGTFGWSNSEGMIQGVIDRKSAGGSGLGDDANFRKLRKGLPDHALVSLFVNPRLIERLLTDASQSPKPSRERLPAMFAHYLEAVAQFGFALQWREGIAIHSHEILDPEKLEPWLKRWLTRPSSSNLANNPISSTAVAVLSANIDFEALDDVVRELIPDADRASFANLKIAAQGILLGRDPVESILPRLQSGVMLSLEIDPDPKVRPSFAWVGLMGWKHGAGLDDLAAPIDNALRTLFAMSALDPKGKEASRKVEIRDLGEGRLTSLTQENRVIIAYSVDRDQLKISNSTEAIARVASAPATSTLSEIRAKFVPEAETFAIADVQRLVREVKRLREPIVNHLATKSHRPAGETGHDLDQLVDLANLFRAFTFSTVTAKDATEIHRSISLIGR